jgi:hypothetical protein
MLVGDGQNSLNVSGKPMGRPLDVPELRRIIGDA